MIASMTAFARAQEQQDWGTAIWEIRSVNHRFLDVNFRMPDSMRELESDLRDALRKQVTRGKVECSLRLQFDRSGSEKLSINESLAQTLIQGAESLSQSIKQDCVINPLDVLKWPGVIETKEVEFEAMKQPLLNSFNEAVGKLVERRQREGDALKQTIMQRLQKMSASLEVVRKHMPKEMEQQKQRLLDRFNEVKLELDETRVEQEMVMLAQKIDIDEEMDRLDTHIKEVTRILEKGGTVGRRLDFLMQELNREANTMTSKAISTDITSIAVEFKVLIEQMREQVQNIE